VTLDILPRYLQPQHYLHDFGDMAPRFNTPQILSTRENRWNIFVPVGSHQNGNRWIVSHAFNLGNMAPNMTYFSPLTLLYLNVT